MIMPLATQVTSCLNVDLLIEYHFCEMEVPQMGIELGSLSKKMDTLLLGHHTSAQIH